MSDAWIVEVRDGGGEWTRRFGVTVPCAKAAHFIAKDLDRGSRHEYRLRHFDTGEITGVLAVAEAGDEKLEPALVVLSS